MFHSTYGFARWDTSRLDASALFMPLAGVGFTCQHHDSIQSINLSRSEQCDAIRLLFALCSSRGRGLFMMFCSRLSPISQAILVL